MATGFLNGWHCTQWTQGQLLGPYYLGSSCEYSQFSIIQVKKATPRVYELQITVTSEAVLAIVSKHLSVIVSI